MAIESNKINCGVGQIGTYFDGCAVTPKDFTKAFLKSPSLKIDLATDTFDESARALAIKKGLLVPLPVPEQIADVPAKNNFQNFPNKRKKFISQGILEFMLQFEANICLVKAMHVLKKKSWELLLLDSEGKFFFDNKGGRLNGFEIHDFSVENESVNDGGSKVALFDVNLQLSQNGTEGYNTRKSFLLSDDNNDFYGMNGVEDVTIEADTLSITALKFSVFSGCDGTTPKLGLATANFQLLNAATGANIAITIVELGGGQYQMNGATAGARIVRLFDQVNNVAVTDIVETQFFRSNELAVTLTT